MDRPIDVRQGINVAPVKVGKKLKNKRNPLPLSNTIQKLKKVRNYKKSKRRDLDYIYVIRSLD